MASTSRVVISPRTMSILSLGVFILRRESFNEPTAVRLPRVTETIVQAVWTSLPELKHVGFQPISAPVRRDRDRFVSEALGHLRHTRVQDATAVDHVALWRGSWRSHREYRPRWRR